MSEHDERGLDGVGERQSPSPADADTTSHDVALTGSGGTPGAERLGIRPSTGGMAGDPGADASDEATSGVAGADGADGADGAGGSPEGLLGTGTGDMDASETGVVGAGQSGTGGIDEQSGVLGTRGGTDRAGIPGGLAGGMDSGEVTGTDEQADASQEGANVQP